MSTLSLSSPTTLPAALYAELSEAEPFGNPSTYPIGAQAHDPVALAENLRSVDLSLSTGDGRLGPLDVGQYAPVAAKGPEPQSFVFEVLAHRCNLDLHAKLDALAIDHRFDDYGPGTHTSPYFDRSLDRSLGPIIASFPDPVNLPERATYTSAEPTYSVFEWSVSLVRRSREFTRISDADATGFRLGGSGQASVTTPALFEPGSTHDVAVDGKGTAVVADGLGRLRIQVDLGPSSSVPQYSPGATTTQVIGTVRID